MSTLAWKKTTRDGKTIATGTKKHGPLHHLQGIFVAVLSRVSPISQLVHATVQQRPLQAQEHTILGAFTTFNTCVTRVMFRFSS